jgi:hypothetical protein
VANTAKRRRGRSRKRRPEGAAAVAQGVGDIATRGDGAALPGAPDASRKPDLKASKVSTRRAAKAPPPTSTFGRRPHAPWHPLPLSEILILAGAIGTVLALRQEASHGRGVHHSHALLVASLVAAGLGTVEVTVREHWSGYRSHAILLGVAIVLAFHSAVVLGAEAIANPPQLLNFVLLPLDFALFVFLFRLLRARFLEARQRRAVTGG